MRKGQKKDKRTEAEKQADQKASEIKQRREEHINEPTIKYSVGQHVIYGSHNKTEVIEVLDGGKILKVHNFGIHQVYGRDVEYSDTQYVAWTSLSPILKNVPEQLCYRDDYHMSFSNTEIRSLFSMVYHFGVDMEPEYQRGLVWNMEDKVALIDSIFHNVEIGKFAFIFHGYDSCLLFEILDGKQRLNALIEFYEGRFKYKGLTFHEMCSRDKNHFTNYNIFVSENRQPMTLEQKCRYFLRLNTSGKPQSAEHIEMVKQLWIKEKAKETK